MRTRPRSASGIDLDTVEMLKETDPDTFWQTPHYEGWPAVLIRFGSADPERVRSMIERSRDWTAARSRRGRGRRSEVTGFARFAAIDWSGAKGKRHKGIAIAMCEAGDEAPAPGAARTMSGRGARCWTGCCGTAAAAPTLFGFDFSFAPPIAERGEYLPGEPGVPPTAREFWAYVERCCRRRGSRRRKLSRARPPPPFLFRHRRRGEGAISCISASATRG